MLIPYFPFEWNSYSFSFTSPCCFLVILVLTLQALYLCNCHLNFEDQLNSDRSTMPTIIKRASGESMHPNSPVAENCGFDNMISKVGDAIATGNERSIPQLDHKIDIALSSPRMYNVSAEFPNCSRASLGDQDSCPPRNSECQANMKQQINIKRRKESIPSLNPIPSIQHSMNVKACSKSIKMGFHKSLQSVMNAQFCDTNTRISGNEDRSQENSSIRSLGLYNQNIESQENSDMSGSLNLLVDAIQLLEGQELPKTIDLQIHKKVSIQVLPKNILRRFKNDLVKPNLQNHHSLVEDHGLGSVNKLAFNKVIQSGDGQHTFISISKVGEMEQGTMSFSRSKRGRLQAFPSKYSDSVLQPWRKISRKVPTI